MNGILLGVAFLAGMILGIWGIGVVIAGIALRTVMRRDTLLIGIVAILLTVLGNARAVEPPVADMVAFSSVDGLGRVASEPRATRNGQLFDVSIAGGPGGAHTVLCVETRDLPLVHGGETVRLRGEVQQLTDLPMSSQASLTSRGCDATLEAAQLVIIQSARGWQGIKVAVRERIASFFRTVAPGDAGALMTGLLIGDDTALAYESREAFLSTGTTHVTAVSGANFAILVTLASMAAGSIGGRRNWGWIIAVATAIWMYALIVGLPPSAVRAALMATLALAAGAIGRIPDFLTLLMVSVVLQLIARPGDLHTLSFQLSVAATLALILVFSGWMYRSRRWWPLLIVLTATAAHLATIPVLAWRIGEVPVLSIPANSAISPLVLLAFPVVAVSGMIGLVAPGLGSIIALPAVWLSSAMVGVVSWFRNAGPEVTVTGELPDGVLILLAIGCWGLIAAMSFDCRVHASQLLSDIRRIVTQWHPGR
ncbi:MAG: ComEC/Rec2 family competence protein [Thermomicrobiales bacterium]